MTESVVVYAELQTRNFTFHAIAFSIEEAYLKIKTTFEKHIEKTQGSLTWEDVCEDVYVRVSKVADGWVS